MITGKLNRLITIQTLISAETDGHSEESWSTADVVRASVIQVDGSRILQDEELKDKVVFKIICWDNNYSDNIKIGYNDLYLFPIRPIVKNPGKSMLTECVIFASAKQSTIAMS